MSRDNQTTNWFPVRSGYIVPRWRGLGPEIRMQWERIKSPVPGRYYKMMVEDPDDGRIKLLVCTVKVRSVHALLVDTFNMAKTAINSRWQVTSLRLLVNREGEVIRASCGPSTKDEIAVYTAAWPSMKPLLETKDDKPQVEAVPAAGTGPAKRASRKRRVLP